MIIQYEKTFNANLANFESSKTNSKSVTVFK